MHVHDADTHINEGRPRCDVIYHEIPRGADEDTERRVNQAFDLLFETVATLKSRKYP
jgi:hypothetical protein